MHQLDLPFIVKFVISSLNVLAHFRTFLILKFRISCLISRAKRKTVCELQILIGQKMKPCELAQKDKETDTSTLSSKAQKVLRVLGFAYLSPTQRCRSNCGLSANKIVVNTLKITVCAKININKVLRLYLLRFNNVCK